MHQGNRSSRAKIEGAEEFLKLADIERNGDGACEDPIRVVDRAGELNRKLVADMSDHRIADKEPVGGGKVALEFERRAIADINGRAQAPEARMRDIAFRIGDADIRRQSVVKLRILGPVDQIEMVRVPLIVAAQG